jgi:hypothetical protein
MASYNVNNGDTLSLDETLTGTVDYININDGVCNITNSSNSGLVVEFASGGYISVKSFGQLNILGSMIEIGTSDGTRGQSIQHWQSTHPINVIWVEKSSGSGEFEPWFGINPGTSTLLDFSNFGDDSRVGRVFKWNDGSIDFSPNAGEGYIPESGCKIVVPNIILSTETPFGSTTTAKVQYDEGGAISMKNVSTSDFNGTLKGNGSLTLESVGFYGSAYIQYCNNFSIKDTHGGIKDNYSTGVSFSYSSNGVIENVSGASIKSKGVTFNYLKDIQADKVYGLVGKRDSSTDFPIQLNTVQGSKVENITCVGGALSISNVSESRVEGIETIASATLIENSTKSCPNIDIDGSSKTVIRDWIVPAGGGAKIAYARMKNSPDIDLINTEIHSSYATNVLAGDVSFNTRVSELYYEGFSGSQPFYFPAKNNGLLLQHIESPLHGEISIEAPNAILKGIEGSSVKTDNDGAAGSNFAQMYTDSTDGKLVFIMAKDSVATDFYSGIVGGVKWSNDGRVYFSNTGDTVEVITPYRVKGVDFKDEDFTINGYGTSAVALDYSIDTGDGFGSFKALNKTNLVAENIDTQYGFVMKIRMTTGTISGTCYVSSIEIPTVDTRYVYPLDFERGRIIFSDNVILDSGAMYYAYYADGYGTSTASPVKDAEGMVISGLVDGQDHVDFTYDFIGSSDGGRTPGQPFDMVVVIAGTNMAKNIALTQTFDEGQLNTFNLRPEKDYGYIGA